MKRYIFTLTACVVCLSASAYDFSVDDIFYNILASGNAVEVTHDYNSENSTTGSYKSKVTVPETVTFFISKVPIVGVESASTSSPLELVRY